VYCAVRPTDGMVDEVAKCISHETSLFLPRFMIGIISQGVVVAYRTMCARYGVFAQSKLAPVFCG
jgi:hypothetical protein